MPLMTKVEAPGVAHNHTPQPRIPRGSCKALEYWELATGSLAAGGSLP